MNIDYALVLFCINCEENCSVLLRLGYKFHKLILFLFEMLSCAHLSCMCGILAGSTFAGMLSPVFMRV